MAKRRPRRARRVQSAPAVQAAAVREQLTQAATQSAAVEAQLHVAELAQQLKKNLATRSLADLTGQSVQLNVLKQLAAEDPATGHDLVEEQAKRAWEIVNFYSLVAAGVGLLPGMGLSFLGVFTTQVLMVKDVAAAFGRDWSTQKSTTVVTALLGTAFGTGVGSGLQALTVTAFPNTVGAVLGLLANPVASYATTQAVGSVFIGSFQNENRAEIQKGVAQSMAVRSITSGGRRRPAAA